MNKLSKEKRAMVVRCLVEGNSLRSVTRITGVHRTTVMKLLCDLGEACSRYQDKTFRNLKCERIQCDEVWSFVYAKEKNASQEMKDAVGAGDVWTWTAIDADTKLIPCWFIGGRDATCAYHFMHDLAVRLEIVFSLLPMDIGLICRPSRMPSEARLTTRCWSRFTVKVPKQKHATAPPNAWDHERLKSQENLNISIFRQATLKGRISLCG